MFSPTLTTLTTLTDLTRSRSTRRAQTALQRVTLTSAIIRQRFSFASARTARAARAGIDALRDARERRRVMPEVDIDVRSTIDR